MKSRFKPWQKLKTRNSILFHGSCRATTAQASQLKRQAGSTSVTSYLISPSPPVSDTERELHSFCFITQKGPLLLPVEMEGGGLLVWSVCPRADMMLTAEKPLQTTAQMCFIWLYLLTHPVCIACEDSIKQRHRTDCRPPNFPPHCCLTCTTVRNIAPHEDTEHLRTVSSLKNVHFDTGLCLLTKAWFWSFAGYVGV